MFMRRRYLGYLAPDVALHPQRRHLYGKYCVYRAGEPVCRTYSERHPSCEKGARWHDGSGDRLAAARGAPRMRAEEKPRQESRA